MTLPQISIMTAFDLISYFILSNKLVHDIPNISKKKSRVELTIIIFFLSLTGGVLGVTAIGKYNIIYGAVIAIFFIYFAFGMAFRETLFIYVISTVILLIIQFVILSALQMLKFENLLDFKFGFIAQLIIICILLLINKYTHIDLLFKYIQKTNKSFKALILNMFVILASLLIYRYIEIEGFLKDILLVAILSIGMLYVNQVLIKNSLKNEYEERMLLTYRRYLPVIDDLMSKIRAKQHEFDNHIQALHMLSFTCTDYDSLVKTMKEYINDLEKDTDIENLIKLDNKILAGFLYEKMRTSKENNIDFKIIIKDYGFNPNLRDYELIEIIGNLIDNAFEASPNNNVVLLYLKKEEDMSIIEIKNKYPYLDNATISNFFKPGFSTKGKGNYGYGLPNIKRILNNQGGGIDLQNEIIDGDNYITFRILIF